MNPETSIPNEFEGVQLSFVSVFPNYDTFDIEQCHCNKFSF